MACGGVWSSLEEGGPGGVQKEIPIRIRYIPLNCNDMRSTADINKLYEIALLLKQERREEICPV